MIKQFVRWTLILAGGATLVVLVAGLFVPESVLVKLNKQAKSTNATTSKLDENIQSKDAQQSVDASKNEDSTPATTVDTQTQPDTTSQAPTSGSSGGSSGGTKPSPTPTPPPSPSPAPPATVAPTLTFTASPTSITSGSSSTLSWSVNSNASPTPTCTASAGWTGAKATSGSLGVSPTSTKTYSLSCSNSAGTSAKSVSVTVTAPVATCGQPGGACSASQVSAHNTPGDCWVIYNASYLILSGSGILGSNGNEVQNHSGGSGNITSHCGSDATTAFTNQHGSQTNVKNIFNSYVVGPVQ